MEEKEREEEKEEESRILTRPNNNSPSLFPRDLSIDNR